MPDTNDNDIDGLRGFLSLSARHSFNTIPSDVADRYHRALTALVAERDALRIELTNAKSFWRPLDERRNTEQRQESDRDLRERLVCAALTGILAHEGRDREFDCVMDDAIWMAGKAIAAMRKEVARE